MRHALYKDYRELRRLARLFSRLVPMSEKECQNFLDAYRVLRDGKSHDLQISKQLASTELMIWGAVRLRHKSKVN